MTAPTFDAFNFLSDPHPFLNHARSHAPVFHDESTGYWVISRFDTIKQMLTNPTVFSSVNALDPITPLDPQVPEILEAGEFGARPFIVNIDGDEHVERKRIFTSVLHPRKVAQFEPFIRDVDQFPDPDNFDIERVGVRRHLGLGHGAHFCVGAGLARLQLRIVLEELSARMPDLQLMTDRPSTYIRNVSFCGPRSLWLQQSSE